MIVSNLFSIYIKDLKEALQKHEDEARHAWKCMSYNPKNEKKALIDYVIGGGKINTESIKKLRKEGISPKSVAYYILLGEEK